MIGDEQRRATAGTDQGRRYHGGEEREGHCAYGHDQPVLSTGRAETVAGRGGWGWGDRVSSGRRERTGGEHRVVVTDRCDTQARRGHAHNSAVGHGRADQDDEMVSSLLLSLLVISPVRGSAKKRGNGGTPHAVATARFYPQNEARSGTLAPFSTLSVFSTVPRSCDPTPRHPGDMSPTHRTGRE